MADRPEPESYEDKLSRLRAATEAIPVPADLADRVLRAIAVRPREPTFAEVILLSSRRVLALAAIAAAAAAVLGFQMERSFDDVDAEFALDEDDDIGGLLP